MKRFSIGVFALAAAAAAAGCGSSGQWAGSTETAKSVAQTYAKIVHQSYADSLQAGQALAGAIDDLLAAPTADGLEAAKQAWLDSREPYLQTEVYRFYDGPIDNPEDGPEGMLNAWPIDEAYVDYTEDAADAGMINDDDVDLTLPFLRGQNELGSEDNIAVGYHPIEFLLWGQDTTPPSAHLPGQRSYTDYLADKGPHAAHADRRAQYLRLLGEGLIDDLTQVRDAWDLSDPSSYGSKFVAGDSSAAIEKILRGMITLSGSEFAGERLQVALDSGDQEDEHSCFSDNTHRDMVGDAKGIQNVWRGTYAALDSANDVSGPGVQALVEELDPALAAEIGAQIAKSLQLAEALRPTPTDPAFDELISRGNTAGNAKVQALIDSLRVQAKLLERVYDQLGFSAARPGG
ncbi:MAG: iron-regulated protein [Myxococcales bacterium]|nr:iron-regulated protein [Myxococcales bacterium]